MESLKSVIQSQSVIHPFLAKIGKEDPLEVTYECEACGHEVPPYRLQSNGRYVRAICICIKERRAREAAHARESQRLQEHIIYTYSWLGKHWTDVPLHTKTFEQFDQTRQLPAFETCLLFSKDLYGSLILHGSYGTGKTHLLAALCNDLETRGIASRFTTAPKLFRAIQERIYRKEDYYELIQKAVKAPLLVIDDIDKAKPSEFREEVYFEIIDERTKAGLPIAISTNRLADLAEFVGGAACSRLSMGQLAVQMDGTDYRMEM